VDPFERQFQRRIKPDAIIAFFVGVLAAYAIQGPVLRLGGGKLFTVLIVALVGGLWYRVRDVV
jgi:hypothetical protein